MNHIITHYDLEDINECPICMVDYKENEITKITSCGHIFHTECIDRWIKKKKAYNCPICRKEGAKHILSFNSTKFGRWNTLSDWCNDFNMAVFLLKQVFKVTRFCSA